MFGDKKTNKSQDALLSQLAKSLDQVIKNQNVLIKNGTIYNDWIQFLNKKNNAQDTFDSQVSKSLSEINSKLSDYMTLANEVKSLKQQVASLSKGDVEG